VCLLCIEITKKSLSGNDLIKNLDEILMVNPQHADKIIELLSKTDPDYLDRLEKELSDKLEENLRDLIIKL
jgi:hypothetical protein